MDFFCLAPFVTGCGTGAALIIAIGAQNAFVLKQGILGNYVFITALICSLVDALLICLGVGGIGTILTSNAVLLNVARWGGAAFLGAYGLHAFRSVFRSETLELGAGSDKFDLKMTIGTVLALSLLNPHVYLDTIVILGSLGAQFQDYERVFFALGAIFVSFLWFFTLGYGAGYLAPLFQKPLSWKILDFLIGCVMWVIALSLILWVPSCLCD